MPPKQPDLRRSRAVLIGISDFRNEQPIPGAVRSMEAMRDLLVGPLCGWPKESVVPLRNVRRRDDLMEPLIQAAGQAEDLLLVYYVGHGSLTTRGDLLMWLCETNKHPDFNSYSGLTMTELRGVLEGSRVPVKNLILDCCMSGVAIRNWQGSTDIPEGALRVEGCYTLTATSHREMAIHEENAPDAMTKFTRNFVEVVRDGIPGAPECLTLDHIYRSLDDRMMRQRLPRPHRMDRVDRPGMVFCRNAAPSDDNGEIDEASRLMAHVAWLENRLGSLESTISASNQQAEKREREINQVRRELNEARRAKRQADDRHGSASPQPPWAQPGLIRTGPVGGPVRHTTGHRSPVPPGGLLHALANLPAPPGAPGAMPTSNYAAGPGLLGAPPVAGAWGNHPRRRGLTVEGAGHGLLAFLAVSVVGFMGLLVIGTLFGWFINRGMANAFGAAGAAGAAMALLTHVRLGEFRDGVLAVFLLSPIILVGGAIDASRGSPDNWGVLVALIVAGAAVGLLTAYQEGGRSATPGALRGYGP